MNRVNRSLLLACLAIALAAPASARAQAPGYAEITTPGDAQDLTGLVSIEGTADHPAFLRYDLAFAHDPNPSDTWFPLGQPVSVRARQTSLGLWDTTALTPGLYQVRLRVHLDGGALFEDRARSLRIGLSPLPATPTAASGQAQASASPTTTEVPPRSVPESPPAPASGDPVGLAVVIGGLTAAALLIGLGLFVPLRRSMATWAGSMRTRRMHRREQRRRRARGGR